MAVVSFQDLAKASSRRFRSRVPLVKVDNFNSFDKEGLGVNGDLGDGIAGFMAISETNWVCDDDEFKMPL